MHTPPWHHPRSPKSLNAESTIQAQMEEEAKARIEKEKVEKEKAIEGVKGTLKEMERFKLSKEFEDYVSKSLNEKAVKGEKDAPKGREQTKEFEDYVAKSVIGVGSRMQKYWMVIKPVTDEGEKEEEPNVATIAPLPRHCPLLEEDTQGGRVMTRETMKTLNGLVGILQTHPYLHCLSDMSVHEDQPTFIYYHNDRKQVVMVQAKSRSLKDIIHNVKNPLVDWAEKYSNWSPVITVADALMCLPMKCICFPVVHLFCKATTGAWFLYICYFLNRRRRFSAEEVARYGRQILEAMAFLYRIGFPVLGHVQSGNIFLSKTHITKCRKVIEFLYTNLKKLLFLRHVQSVDQDDVCRLGGYENTLLGYRSRFYRMCKDHLEHMDVIMFGHLVFEMSCGYELTTLVPEEEDYKAVKDEEVKKLLHFIFPDSGFPSIDKILSLDFFQSVELSELSEFDENKIKLTDDMKDLLARVRGKDGSEEFSDSKHKRRRRNKCRVS